MPTTAWSTVQKRQPALQNCHPPLVKRKENDYPAEALHTDVVGVGAAGRPVDDPVPQLVIGRVPRHPAEQLAPILHQDCGEREKQKPEARYLNTLTLKQQCRRQDLHPPQPLTAAVFGNPAHICGQPIDVEVFPIKVGTLLIPEILLQL